MRVRGKKMTGMTNFGEALIVRLKVGEAKH